MIIGSNAGSILIIASLVLSMVALAFAAAAAAGKEWSQRPSQILYMCTSAVIAASVILLLNYFLRGEYRIEYVYANSSRDLSTAYRIAALWAGKEGSFLLWLFFLNIFGIFTLREKQSATAVVTSVILATQIFILIMLLVESPFAYVWEKYPDSFSPGLAPGDGSGLNPLLKDPWMVTHPPVLFLGYASATIPFGYAIAAMIKKESGDWIRLAHPWLLFSTVTLGIGIFLGGYWAYSVLGWGGYWGWDSVENSSLIPWLISIALLHGFLIQRRSGSLVRTNILLALVYFILVWLSAYLTRSGVLSNFSVHSFSASHIAPYLMAFLALSCFGSMTIFALRWHSMNGTKLESDILNWKILTVYGIIVIVLYSIIILGGTTMPVTSGWFMARPSNVTEAFYNNFSRPLGILMLLLMAASTTLAITRRENLLKKQIITAFIISLILSSLLNAGYTDRPFAYAMATIALFLIACALVDIRKTGSSSILPSRITHIGVGLLALGIVTSNFHGSSLHKKLVKGKESPVGSFSLTFLGLKEGKESSLQFALSDGKTKKTIETSYYIDQKTESLYKEPHIITGFLNDIYIAPEQFESGAESATQLVMAKGEEREFSGLKVRFIGFRTEHMTSGNPITYADIVVNGMPLSPGMALTREGAHHMDRHIPGTDRSISLADLDATSKKILLTVTPGKHVAIPPDTVLITVTMKRLIWLVWLGTIFIAGGSAYACARALAKKQQR